MDTADSQEVEQDYKAPFYVYILNALFFWPSEMFFRLPYVERMFHTKYSIIIAIPLMLVIPFFFWGMALALCVAALMGLGVVH